MAIADSVPTPTTRRIPSYARGTQRSRLRVLGAISKLRSLIVQSIKHMDLQLGAHISVLYEVMRCPVMKSSELVMYQAELI